MALSDEHLAEIRRRAEAATPGPWFAEDWVDEFMVVDSYWRYVEIDGTPTGIYLADDGVDLEDDQHMDIEKLRANSRFIETARLDTIDLLDEIEHLRARARPEGHQNSQVAETR